jgi:hypothetical protein
MTQGLEVRQIKLVNGDEILTEVIAEDYDSILIRNPLKIYKEKIIFSGKAREANFFSPWMTFGNDMDFAIARSNILAEAIVNELVVEHYTMLTQAEDNNEVTIGDVNVTEDTNTDDGSNGPVYH